jgi:hypothetical protein
MYAVVKPAGKGRFKVTGIFPDWPHDGKPFIEFPRKHRPGG